MQAYIFWMGLGRWRRVSRSGACGGRGRFAASPATASNSMAGFCTGECWGAGGAGVLTALAAGADAAEGGEGAGWRGWVSPWLAH